MLNTYLQAFGQNGRETPQKNVSMHVSDNTRVADDGKLLLFGLSSQNFVHRQKGGEGPHELQLCVGIEPIALANAIAVAIIIPIHPHCRVSNVIPPGRRENLPVFLRAFAIV